MEYVSTGVRGLDEILGGGFLRDSFFLLQGDPGAGKTTVALQFLLAGAQRGEKGLYVTLTETTAELKRTAESHGWTLDGISICDLTASDLAASGDSQYMMFHPSEVELGQTTREILREVERSEARRVVFDGLAELRLLAAEPLRYRRQLLALKRFFADRHVTVLLLDDRTGSVGQLDPGSIVNGNIVLEHFLPGYGSARRRLSVTKVRGSGYRGGYHDYEILRGGVVVHPRLVAAEHAGRFEPGELRSGVQNLDDMLHGGLEHGTTTLLIGPSGVGKSTIAMQYVAQALKEGGRAAVFTFDEVLATLFGRCEKLVSNGIRRYVDSGHLHAQQVDPAELAPGAFAERVREFVEAGARIVIIDSLNGYMSAMPDERFLTTQLHELFAYLNQQGIVTIVTAAQHGLIAASTPELDVSYLADTVLMLRYFEVDAQIRQAVSVFKKRTGGHERSLRELQITAQGVHVGDPLSDFHGIMTGVPEYLGGTRPLESDGARA